MAVPGKGAALWKSITARRLRSKDNVPKPGSFFKGTAIFGCGLGKKPTRLYMDDFSLGKGPPPEPERKMNLFFQG